MCGIAGLVSNGTIDPNVLRAMGDAIAHRGPDDHDQWIEPQAGVGFSHRRLAILDLSPRGHQPMASANGRYVISYNGEIYNHEALRAELDAAGASPEGGWRGHSDTETLLQCIVVWGLAGALRNAAGMFAFSLWDAKEQTLALARDRFGEKPLYYGWVGGDFVFGSELKAIRAHPRFDGAIDRDALALYAARTYIPAPFSIYRRIFKLEPGCILTVSPSAATSPRDGPVETSAPGLALERYWSYRDVVRDGLDNPIEDAGEALDALEQVLAKAISDQSVADVPVGAFLSGGIDSSTIAALYQKYSAIPVRTFTIGFEEAGYNEAVDAKAVASFLKTDHNEHYVTVNEARDVIPLLPAMYDEPFADSSQIPTYLVSRFARQQVTVALTGDGGDELFGGYNRHIMAPRLWGQLKRVPAPLRAAIGPLGQIPSNLLGGVAGLFPGTRQPHIGAKLQKAFRVAGSARKFDDVYRSFLDEWSGEQSPVIGARRAIGFPQVDFGIAGSDALRTMLCDAISYLPDDILCKVDRASMAVSLETRVPFLDHRVAELAARLPIALKVNGGVGKSILRQLLYREAPAALFDRPKAGFAVPVGHWIKGPLRGWAEELLDPSRMRSEGYFDPVPIQRRWRDHLSGRRDSAPALWAVLMFQAWLRSQAEPLSRAA